MKKNLLRSLLLGSTFQLLTWAWFPFYSFAQYGNYFAGVDAGKVNTGDQNSFVGYQAGSKNTTGRGNTLMGYQAGFKNSSGVNNSFIGKWSGGSNTTGSANSFFGSFSGQNNYTASNGVFLGFYAGFLNTTGNNNSYVGAYAGPYNTTGYKNSFIGASAGYNNQTGSLNTILGSNAAFTNKSGNQNVVIGESSGYFATGSNNVFIGYKAGRGMEDAHSGINNAYLGALAGFFNSTGRENTASGYMAGYSNTTGNSNTYFGTFTGFFNKTGNNNSFYGYLARPAESQPNLTNATAIGSNALISKSNAMVLGSIKGKNEATANVNVGIGTDAPAYRLHVNSSEAAKTGSSSWKVASDSRLKKDVAEFNDGISIIEQMRPVWFRYNGKAGITDENRFVGILAQDMQKIAPYTVGEFIYQDSTGAEEKYLDYDATAVTYLLVNAAKELNKENEILKNQIWVLQQQLNRIEQKISGTPSNGPVAFAQLFQNEPNPYGETTTIRYRVPETAKSAKIVFYSSSGQQVHAVEITKKGEGSLPIRKMPVASGVYLYQLWVDGKVMDSKKLVQNP